MTTTTLPVPAHAVPTLGGYLRERRARLPPGPGDGGRRRTPGLRREEVAARAGVSVTWYTWLEQGRGGPPSAVVLERLARALELDAAGREILFLLGQHRPPPLQPSCPPLVTPALRSVLDALPGAPAIVKTPAWNIVAWNAAAAAVLTDYAALSAGERNLLRRMFRDSSLRATQPDWEENARFLIAVFRIDVARAGGCAEAAALVAELQAASAEFRRLWSETDARSYGTGFKRLRHPRAGLVELRYSAFAVDGSEGLSMIVFTPASPEDARTVETILASAARGGAVPARRRQPA